MHFGQGNEQVPSQLNDSLVGGSLLELEDIHFEKINGTNHSLLSVLN